MTTVAPVGESKAKDIRSPKIKDTAEVTAERTITAPKLLQTLREERAGKMIRLEISIAPIIRIPKTMVIAVKIAINELKRFVFVPVAFANDSSKVIAKILL